MKIYAISDSFLTPYNKLPKMLLEAIESGCSIFQFRDKNASDIAISGLCGELNDICKKNNILFVLNDRVELALKLGVSGLHLGLDDEKIPFSEIRKSFSGMIGISCYGDINRALHYQSLGADYVAFGSIFKSPTKQDSNVIGVEILNRAKSQLHIPICAIGGINIKNIIKVKNADMVAMISSIWIGDIKTNIRNLNDRLKSCK
ncbi:thiamine phosphate synthase [Helicobacter sp. 16-1353]|uniref:thiamine phosphate synthase n=1 Tax=Helicobacter sp. 16-1353 TaxID=2004996 RepID=UPI00215CA95C|nr:thiamine phosphate synthase [Helicobacter sp. 16-1353]